MSSGVRGLLLVVVCAASPARHAVALAGLLLAQGWQVRVVGTPEAGSWLDVTGIEEVTGFRPAVTAGDLGPDGLGHPEAILVAPATLNSIAKVASMLNDCLALDVIHSALGDRVPVHLFPHVKGAFASHPGFDAKLAVLRDFGVEVHRDDAVCEGGCPAERHWPAVAAAMLCVSGGLAGIVVRPETLDDVAATARAHIASWRSGYQDLVPPHALDRMNLDQQVARRTLALTEPESSTTWIAARGKQVLGHVTVRPYPDEAAAGQIWACYTDPRSWGTGVADLLLRQGLALLEQDVVRLWVLEANLRAIAFYRRHGFRADGQRSIYEFGGAGELPMIRMTLDRTVHKGQ